MYISIETSDLKPGDVKVLRAIADALEADETSGSKTVQADRAEERKTAAAAAAPAKAKASKAPARQEPPAAAEPEPEPPAEEEASDEPAASGEALTLDDAVSRATELVQAGKSGLVKKALAAAGAKRVSELPESAIPDFISALDAG